MSRATRTPLILAGLVAIYVATVLNVAFWGHLMADVAPVQTSDWMLVGSIGVLIVSLYAMLMVAVAHPYVLKPIAIAALMAGAPLAYLGTEYGLGVTTGLVQTALETDAAETRDLLTSKLALTMLFLGVLPAILVSRWRLDWPSAAVRIRQNAIALVALAAVTCGLVAANFGSLASLFREDRSLQALLVPYGAVSSMVGAVNRSRDAGARPAALEQIGRDAVARAPSAAKPSLTVLVVGETARADHFSLNGYGRPTTPKLAAIERLVSFTDTTSCATLTAASVPCLFSDVGLAGTSKDIAQRRENLLDVVGQAGFDVAWIDNQAGCKGVCARVPTINVSMQTDPRYCADGECHDDVLVEAVRTRTSDLRRETVLVLHMMGSHGPAYHKRVPAAFKTFQPACDTSQFSHCTRDQIIAAYDNTIAYTDHVLTELVGVLDALATKGHATAMLYVSDHGESLGEGNVFLHGLPNAVAPRGQRHVPFLVWLSETFAQRFGVDPSCLERQRHAPTSHDNIFHSTLGLLNIATAARQDRLDLTQGCRG